MSTTKPLAGMERGSAAFSRATPAMSPRPSRCEAPTVVTMPASGSAISHRRPISPWWFVPISTTSASVEASARKIVCGTPTSLLKELGEPSVRQRDASSSTSMFLTVVLPQLPVTPTTRADKRRRCMLARSPRARRVSAATITAAPGGSAAATSRAEARSSSTTAAAPLAQASSANRLPSWFCPSRAMYTSPRWILRVSVHTRVARIPASPATNSAPVARSTTATGKPRVESCAEAAPKVLVEVMPAPPWKGLRGRPCGRRTRARSIRWSGWTRGPCRR